MLHIFQQLQTAQSRISPSIYIQFKLIYPTTARHFFLKKTSVCIYEWVGVCSPARGCPKWILGVFLVHSPPYLLKQGLSPNLKLYSLKQDLSLNLKPVDSELASWLRGLWSLSLQRLDCSLGYLHEFWDLNWSPHIHLARVVPFCLLGDSNSFIYLFIIFLLLPLKLCHWKHSPSLGQGFLAPTLLETCRISGSNPDLFNEKHHFNKVSGDFMGELPLWKHHSKTWLCILLIKDRQLLKISQKMLILKPAAGKTPWLTSACHEQAWGPRFKPKSTHHTHSQALWRTEPVITSSEEVEIGQFLTLYGQAV